MMGYDLLLTGHGLVRWLALAALTGALVAGISALRRGGWSPAGRRWATAWAGLLTVQLPLGLAFYATPGSVARLLAVDPAAAMRNPAARFIAVEHAALMVLALGLAHAGAAAARGASTNPRRSRIAVCLIAASAAAVLSAIPWPFGPHPRPWLRWG